MTEFGIFNVIGPSWRGFQSIDRLVIFGDSYSDVGWPLSKYKRPTFEHPLGAPWPGVPLTESSQHPNWVGYLVKSQEADHHFLLAYVYAIQGHFAEDVSGQINMFHQHLKSMADWDPFVPADVLFVTWIGINDCAFYTEHASHIQKLFAKQDKLYEAGARNFLFIDVPPCHRAPGAARVGRSNLSTSYEDWNENLVIQAREFHNRHPDATLLMFSAWDFFQHILDFPAASGFSSTRAGGDIWMDHLHPTSKVHKLIAGQIDKFLSQVPPHKSNEPDAVDGQTTKAE